MNCPYCKATATQNSSGNGGDIFVGECLGRDTECFDPDIGYFICDIDTDHVFYADPTKQLTKERDGV